ncbi:transposase [Endozoicomonas sp. SCSIO W0465]|nr:transposase [Endozoicomonas sp. SCSIO W0465]USE36051.1 transposase [Endozoicomonas sp. SCSIO W0465]
MRFWTRTIYFADESSARSDYHSGTTWGKKGRTPVVEATGARFGINLISAVSGEGTMRYMTINGRFNADQFIRFLKQLVRTHDRPVLVVADGHSAHKAKGSILITNCSTVKTDCRSRKTRIEQHYRTIC